MVLDGDKGSRFQILKARGPGKFISPRLTPDKVLKKCSILEKRSLSLCFTCFLNFECARSPRAEYDELRKRLFDTGRVLSIARACKGLTVLKMHSILGNRSLSSYFEIFRGACTSCGRRDEFCAGLAHPRKLYIQQLLDSSVGRSHLMD